MAIKKKIKKLEFFKKNRKIEKKINYNSRSIKKTKNSSAKKINNMSGKSSEAKTSRASNPFTKFYQKTVLNNSRISSIPLNIQNIENLLKGLYQLHETMGRQIQDIATGKNPRHLTKKLWGR